MIANGSALGVPEILTPHDLMTNNVKINTLYVAQIFNTRHGLDDLDEEIEIIEETQEERQFRLWINSLGIDGVNLRDLYEGLRDGVVLCKVVDHIEGGAINWSKVRDPPKNMFDKNGNCNTATDAMKASLGCPMVGVNGTNIQKGDKKDILATVW